MKRGMPELLWDDSTIVRASQIAWLGEGDDCECYLIDDNLVFRLARHRKASASLERELRLLPALFERTGVPIPRLHGSGTRIDTGQRFVVYPILPGTVLRPDALAALPAACRHQIIVGMADFIRQLHAFPLQDARSIGYQELVPSEYLSHLIRQGRASIAGRLDPIIWQHYETMINNFLESDELLAYSPSLLHADLSPDHFLIDTEACSLTGVLDFGDCCIGDPCWDFIYILQEYGEEMLDQVLASYSSALPRHVKRRIHIYQQMNNVQFCLSRQEEGDDEAFQQAIRTLIAQAAAGTLF